MEMKLQTLDIENFKRIGKLKLDFGGKNASIYGDNGTCKTTIYDALTWLLFGKDSLGVSNFEVKPLGKDGKPRAAGVMPTVTAVLNIDGTDIKLRKALREKWERVRGSVEQRLTGNTKDYAVDDVPRKENEFERIIAGFIDEAVFLQLTSVSYFCGTLKWQDRRARLFELCNVASDETILAGAPAQFAELREQVGRRTVDEFKATLAAQRKNARDTLNALPVRIDEQDKTILALGNADYDALRAQETALTVERLALQSELLKLENNTLLAQKQAARETVQNDLRRLEMDNRQHRQSQEVHEEDARPAVREEIERCRCALADLSERRAAAERETNALAAQIADCIAQWNALDARTFTEGGVCGLCGQALPKGMLADARAAWNAENEREKNEVVARSGTYKERLAREKTRLDACDAEQAAQQDKLTAAQARLMGMTAPEPVVICDLPNYGAQTAALQKTLCDLDAALDALRGETVNIRRGTEEKLAVLDTALRTLRGKLAAEQAITNAQNRMEELRQEQKAAAAFGENAERLIELCEDFTRYKVQSITEAVNGKFSRVKFRLFTEQVNGGLAECCDATVDGVPYCGNLNSAAKVNAGLDVIAALSAHEGVRVPLFIDNAESVTRLLPVATQMIRLVVSEPDRELRVEV